MLPVYTSWPRTLKLSKFSCLQCGFSSIYHYCTNFLVHSYNYRYSTMSAFPYLHTGNTNYRKSILLYLSVKIFIKYFVLSSLQYNLAKFACLQWMDYSCWHSFVPLLNFAWYASILWLSLSRSRTSLIYSLHLKSVVAQSRSLHTEGQIFNFEEMCRK